VRQWVLSVPKRLRDFLQRDAETLSAVLHILLRVIEAWLRERRRCASAWLGAVSFVQRFGSALSAHVHVDFPPETRAVSPVRAHCLRRTLPRTRSVARE
jgi:hypothetical protein